MNLRRGGGVDNGVHVDEKGTKLSAKKTSRDSSLLGTEENLLQCCLDSISDTDAQLGFLKIAIQILVSFEEDELAGELAARRGEDAGAGRRRSSSMVEERSDFRFDISQVPDTLFVWLPFLCLFLPANEIYTAVRHIYKSVIPEYLRADQLQRNADALLIWEIVKVLPVYEIA